MSEYIGVLNVETDWDFGFIIDNETFCGNEETVLIKSIDELKNIKFLGSFGSPFSANTKIWEFEEALKCIIENPNADFSNLGGNRGAMWTPFVKQISA